MANGRVVTPGSHEDARQRLLDSMLKEKGIAVDTDSMSRHEGQDMAAPLSYCQQRLWFLSQLTPDQTSYNVSAAFRIRGRVDLDSLNRAIHEIVHRHEALRTHFVLIDGEPRQIVDDPPSVAIVIERIAGWDDFERRAKEEASKRFNLESGPLLRFCVFQSDSGENLLLFTLHHITSDWWSMAILKYELATLYSAFAAGRPSPLKPLAFQYSDYATWQRASISSRELQASLRYWKIQLEGSETLALPTDHARPAEPSYQGKRAYFSLGRETTNKLKAISKSHSATLFMTLLAAFNLFLGRYSGQRDIVVGAPIAGRTRLELEEIIGFFVNTLVLRSRVDPEKTFRQMLADVRAMTLEAYANQEIPFEKIVEELQPTRDLSRNPLFQVAFAFQIAPASAGTGVDSIFEEVGLSSDVTQFDLTLFVYESRDDISGSFEYRTDLWDAPTIERMIGHWKQILENLLNHPDKPVGTLSILRDAEGSELKKWNSTNRNFDAVGTIQQMIEDRAELVPDAIAVVTSGASLSYGDINVAANRLSRHLSKLGVCLETKVGISLERSADIVVALLAVIKCGACYVPLDTNLPPVRLSYIVESMGISKILTQTHLCSWIAESLGELAGHRDLLCLDNAPVERPDRNGIRIIDSSKWNSEDSTNPPLAESRNNLSYVIFTSGSTGTPKGVMVRQRSVINLIDWMNRTFDIGPTDRVMMVSSLSFDLSVYDIFGLLAAGGSVRIVSDEELHNPDALLSILALEKITVWDSAPAVLQQLRPLMEDANQKKAPLRLVLLSGDWIPVSLPDIVRRVFPSAEVVGLGGATEATVWSNYYRITTVRPDWVSIPYGRPIQNAQYYVLDPFMEQVPSGVAGDLYIGGDCLCDGYAEQPELTAERFVPDPFGDYAGRRLYKTGDLVRHTLSGELEFLGRVDRQVKIRGYRIELGEIEGALLAHPGVKEVVVEARKWGGHDKRLVAYFVAAAASPGPDAAELRGFLKDRLPEFMIPTAYVSLTGLPVTPNGKIDRRSLPDPDDLVGDARNEDYAKPRNAVETQLAEIWSSVLGNSPIGVYDNFFELGGDSILSIQVVARAARQGIRITPAQLYQRQTIAELADVAIADEEFVGEQGVVTGEIPLTPIQQWFFAQQDADLHHWNQAVLLAVQDSLTAAQWKQLVASIQDHHDALRIRFEHRNNSWYQWNAPLGEIVPFEEFNIRGDTEEIRLARLTELANTLQASLDLESGPLWRVAFFHFLDESGRTGEEGRLLVVVHHLVIDGVSWRALLEDMQQAQRQLEDGTAPSFGRKTSSYREWSLTFQEHARSLSVQSQSDYWNWVSHTSCGEVPHDCGVGKNLEGTAETIAVYLSPEDTEVLLRETLVRLKAQINEVLLEAVAYAVTKWAGRRQITLDMEGHGREDISSALDLSRTVGWFTTIFPVRLDLGEDGTPALERLRRVKEQYRQVPNRGLGFNALRYLASENSAPPRWSTSDILFNYLGQFDTVLETGWRATGEDLGQVRSPQARRMYKVEITASIMGGHLRWEWRYSNNLHGKRTIEHLAQACISELIALIKEGSKTSTEAFVASDFELLQVNNSELDNILSLIPDLSEETRGQ